MAAIISTRMNHPCPAADGAAAARAANAPEEWPVPGGEAVLAETEPAASANATKAGEG